MKGSYVYSKNDRMLKIQLTNANAVNMIDCSCYKCRCSKIIYFWCSNANAFGSNMHRKQQMYEMYVGLGVFGNSNLAVKYFIYGTIVLSNKVLKRN